MCHNILVRFLGKIFSNKVCVHLVEICTEVLCIFFLRYFTRIVTYTFSNSSHLGQAVECTETPPAASVKC